jgi:hypothetical protein
MGIKNSALCNFCIQEEDSILHYLWGCPAAKRFWTSFNIWLSSALDLEVFELTPKETVLGESSLQKMVPYLFLVARNYIHRCKWTDTKPVLNIFKIKVKQKEKIKILMRLLKIKRTNMIINGVTYMNLIYSGLLLSTCKKIIYT